MLRGLSWVGRSRPSQSIRSRSAWEFLGPHTIGNAEFRQDLLLEGFHGFGVVVGFVIVTHQMQKTVDRQMAEMMIERFLLVIGLPAHRFIGNGDVAEHPRRIVRTAAAGRLQGWK